MDHKSTMTYEVIGSVRFLCHDMVQNASLYMNIGGVSMEQAATVVA